MALVYDVLHKGHILLFFTTCHFATQSPQNDRCLQGINTVEISFSKHITQEFSSFDLILACDSAVPHLSSKKEILKTFKGFNSGIVPGGGCLISVRNYSTFDRISQDTRLVPRLTHQIEGGRIILFDLWEFNGDMYQITTYILEELEGKDLKATAVRAGKYYCIEMDELEHLFLQAGFQKVITNRDRYFQPLLLAQKEA